jgi:hypothetical protein
LRSIPARRRYFVGAVVPVLPVMFGARTVWPTVLCGGAMIAAVSAVVVFISGMNVRRRIALNVLITGYAVLVTYVLGFLTKTPARRPDPKETVSRSAAVIVRSTSSCSRDEPRNAGLHDGIEPDA